MNNNVSIVLPCRDEQEALGECISKIKAVFAQHNITGEIIVSDSSSDNSPTIAKELGATVVKHDKEGYGIACLEGFQHAKGDYIFFADPDATYDFAEIPKFLTALANGYDLVIGNRFGGTIEEGAMPWLHRYIGNPVLSAILRLLFKANISDAHCGMRAVKRDTLNKLSLSAPGMEFATEMIIATYRTNLLTHEIPINYHQRKGKSKMRPFRDGLRHLKIMFIHRIS